VPAANVGGGAGRQSASQQGDTSENATTGSLEVSINGTGAADVFIDGVPRGRTPLTYTLATGRHVVSLRPVNAYSPATISVNVSAGSTARAVFSPR
jgi:hypothetical protein